VGKNLLLISQKPEDIEFSTQLVATAEMELWTAKTAAEGAAVVQGQECAVILVDASTEEQYKEFEKAIQDTVGMFSDKINSNAIHFLSSAPLEEVPYLIQSPIFGHLRSA
jgi:predicted signal transduction protein with EAL and GGDEF domain